VQLFLVPSEPPTNILAVSYTSTTINVTWDHFNINYNTSTFFEDFYLYYVFYHNLDDGTDWNNVGTKNNNIDLIDLKPGTLYGLRILISTTASNGLASEEIKIRTVAGGRLCESYSNYLKCRRLKDSVLNY